MCQCKLIHVDSVLQRRRRVEGGLLRLRVSSKMHGSGMRSDVDVTTCLKLLCMSPPEAERQSKHPDIEVQPGRLHREIHRFSGPEMPEDNAE